VRSERFCFIKGIVSWAAIRVNGKFKILQRAGAGAIKRRVLTLSRSALQ